MVLWLGLVGCRIERTPIDYRLPDGFEGGFAVLYERPEAGPLPRTDDRIQVRIPADGDPIVRTSDRVEEGWGADRYWIGDRRVTGDDASTQYGANGIRGTCVYFSNVVGPRDGADAARDALAAKLDTTCAAVAK